MNRVGAHLHYSEGKAPGIKTTEKLYTHAPKSVCEHKDREVMANKTC